MAQKLQRVLSGFCSCLLIFANSYTFEPLFTTSTVSSFRYFIQVFLENESKVMFLQVNTCPTNVYVGLAIIIHSNQLKTVLALTSYPGFVFQSFCFYRVLPVTMVTFDMGEQIMLTFLYRLSWFNLAMTPEFRNLNIALLNSRD